MQANTLPSYTPYTSGWSQKVKTIFSEEGYVADYQIKRKKVKKIMQLNPLILRRP